jgi:hypothetical protein
MKGRCMKVLAAFVAVFAVTTSLLAQSDLEVSAGLSMLVYQSVYSFEQSTAIETAVRGHAIKTLDWQAGTRLGIDRMLPDVFVRLLVAPRSGMWSPFLGVEFGYTNRGRFSDGNLLLRESRKAMEGEISHFYIAGHSAPLSFTWRKKWRISVMELHIGTHAQHMGRTMRVQAGLAIARSF